MFYSYFRLCLVVDDCAFLLIVVVVHLHGRYGPRMGAVVAASAWRINLQNTPSKAHCKTPRPTWPYGYGNGGIRGTTGLCVYIYIFAGVTRRVIPYNARDGNKVPVGSPWAVVTINDTPATISTTPVQYE